MLSVTSPSPVSVYGRICVVASLAAEPDISELPPLSDEALAFLDALVANFSVDDASAVKAIEATTNHDVRPSSTGSRTNQALPELAPHSRNSVHFACTSEDINNVRMR